MHTPESAPRPTKRRHFFRWVFLAVQALFLIWIIGGIAASGPKDCGTLSAEACRSASQVGTGIGIFLIIFLWMAVDVIVALSWLVFRKRS